MATFILLSVKIWQNSEEVKAHKPLQLTDLQKSISILLKWVSTPQYLYRYSQSPAESDIIRF
jgi:hypothetical protein